MKVVMMPIGDLFNHRNPPDLIWEYGTSHDGRKGWTYRAMKPVKSGEQVYISYGAEKTNQDLLPVYGFIDSTNTEPFKSYLKLKIKKSDPLLDRKVKILGGKEQLFVINLVPDVETLSMLRISNLDPIEDSEKLEALESTSTPYLGAITPISL